MTSRTYQGFTTVLRVSESFLLMALWVVGGAIAAGMIFEALLIWGIDGDLRVGWKTIWIYGAVGISILGVLLLYTRNWISRRYSRNYLMPLIPGLIGFALIAYLFAIALGGFLMAEIG